MNNITKELTNLIEKKINPYNDTRIYYAKEVTFDYSGKAIRIDVVQFKPRNNSVGGIEQGDFYCYEVKSSVEDFNSKHGHNFIGDYNYYVMPADVYYNIETKIPFGVGVYCPVESYGGTILKSFKNARRMGRERSVSEILLMMFRSANRDNIKIRKVNNE